MIDTPLPDSSELTRQDFISSRWREIIGDTQITYCSRVSLAFETEYRKANNEGNLTQAKVLQLLTAASSMMLTNKSRNTPYEPEWTYGGRTAPTPDWFTESDIDFIAGILEEIDDPMLRGRLADLVWIKKYPTDFRFALKAIESYRSMDLNAETHTSEIGKGWRRALALSRMMGKTASNHIQEIESDLRTKFDAAAKDDNRFGHWLAETLSEFGLGNGKEENIATKLAAIAQELESTGDVDTARDYYQLAGEWFSQTGQESKRADMTTAIAEAWVKEAESWLSSDSPSAIAAEGCYNKAIQIYREIPRGERQERQVDQRIAELIQLHEGTGKLTLGEMKTITTTGIDPSQITRQSKAAVKGNPPLEALEAFTSPNHANPEELRKHAQETLASYPYIALASGTIFTTDGRVAEKITGIIPGIPSPDESEPAIWAEMAQEYGTHMAMVVIGCILPALEILHIEHRFQEADFITLAKNSPMVPPGREKLFGKALFNGYEKDFATALHLITPQIEHMVRYHLKHAGVTTIRTDPRGIEDENSLSTLIEEPAFKQIFGEKLRWTRKFGQVAK